MKVLHLLTTQTFSGAENVVCQIVGMFQDDADVEMVYCSLDGQIREALQERNIAFAPVEKVSVKEIKRVIAEQKPDVVHAHDMRASFVAAMACGKIPLISHIHGKVPDAAKVSKRSIAYSFAAKKAKHIFWVSESSYCGYVFSKFVAKKSSVLYNTINISTLLEKAAQDKNAYDYDIVFLGRLAEEKDPCRFVRVVKIIAKQFPQVRVAMVGTGTLKSVVADAIRAEGLEQNIFLLGFQTNPFGILKNAKLMLMTSRREGTPMCALEAMALGVPVVCTPTDGLKEIVRNGETGFWAETDEMLAEKSLLLLMDENRQKTFSQNARAFSKKLNNIEDYREKLSDAYQLARGMR